APPPGWQLAHVNWPSDVMRPEWNSISPWRAASGFASPSVMFRRTWKVRASMTVSESPSVLLTTRVLPSPDRASRRGLAWVGMRRSEEHTSELQSRGHLVCRLLLEKKKYNRVNNRQLRHQCEGLHLARYFRAHAARCHH